MTKNFLWYFILNALQFYKYASYSSYFKNVQLASRNYFALGAGFGGSDSKKSNEPIDGKNIFQLKKQILELQNDDSCICCSGTIYGNCCKILHDEIVNSSHSRKFLLSADPESIVRARYAAYALGLGDFIIETTHSSHKVITVNFNT